MCAVQIIHLLFSIKSLLKPLTLFDWKSYGHGIIGGVVFGVVLQTGAKLQVIVVASLQAAQAESALHAGPAAALPVLSRHGIDAVNIGLHFSHWNLQQVFSSAVHADPVGSLMNSSLVHLPYPFPAN
jgi:hypothetical protein